MNSITNNLLNNSFNFLISLMIYIGQRRRFNQNNNTFNLSYVNSFDLYIGLWNLIGLVFLMRELTHRKMKQSLKDHSSHFQWLCGTFGKWILSIGINPLKCRTLWRANCMMSECCEMMVKVIP